VKLEGIKFGRYLNIVLSYLPLARDEFSRKITLLSREFSNDTLDKENYQDLTEIGCKIINDFNSRKKMNFFGDFYDEGVTSFLFFESQYLIFHAVEDTRPLYRKLFFEISKFLWRLGFFNILQITIRRKSMIKEMVIHLLECIFNPKIVDSIKALRAFALRDFIGSHPKSKNKLLDKVLSLHLLNKIEYLDYDDIIHEDYLINWLEKPQDIEEAKVPFKGSIPEEYKKWLEIFLVKLKVTRDIFPDEQDMMGWMSNSTSYNHLKTFKKYQRIHKLKFEDVWPSSFKYERCVIQVSPGNCRDAWKGDVQTLLQLKFYDYIIKNIVKYHSKSAMCNEFQFQKRLERIKSHDGIYGMIDLKKSGITVPHELISVTLNCLEEFLNFPMSHWTNSIKNASIQNGDKIVIPKRGVGLGMANSLVTLMNCIIMDTLGVDAIIYNDDIVMCLKEYDEIVSVERFYNDVIDWPVKTEKSIFGDKFVFLEEYYKFDTEWYEKEQRTFMPLADFIFSENIWEVKEKFVGFKRAFTSVSEELFTSIANLYMEIHGSEYEQGVKFLGPEKILPLELGGWELYEYRGVNPILRIIPFLTDYGRSKISSILERYDEFNETMKVHYKKKVSGIYPRRYKIQTDDPKGKEIIDEFGFEQFYKQSDDLLNSMELSSFKATKLNKIKGRKTFNRLKIWNSNHVISYSSSYLVAEELIRLDKIKRYFTLEDYLIDEIQTIRNENVPGHIERYSHINTRPFEQALAMLNFYNIEYSTNYPLKVTPEYIPSRDELRVQSYNFGGFVPEKLNFSEEVIRETTKISLFPEVTLAEYCYRNKVFITCLKLKINDKYIIDSVEIPTILVGVGNKEIEMPPYLFKVSNRIFEIFKNLMSKAPNAFKLIRDNLINDKNVQGQFIKTVMSLSTIVEKHSHLENEYLNLAGQPDRYFVRLSDDSDDELFNLGSEPDQESKEEFDPFSLFD
jgi:hypothetical protein